MAGPRLLMKIFALVILSILSLQHFSTGEKNAQDALRMRKVLPFIFSPIGNVTAVQSREARLSCLVRDLDNHKIAWIQKNWKGQRIVLAFGTQAVTKNPRISASHEGLEWILTITNVTKEYEGIYMCQINTTPRITNQGFLIVRVPPDINDRASSSHLTVDEGSNATLVCDASGDPEPTISWKREVVQGSFISVYKPGEFASQKMLFLQNVDRKMAGVYLCMARNGVPPIVSKRMVLQVNFPPTIIEESLGRTYGVVMGTDVTLTCRFKAMPRGKAEWYKEDKLLNPEPPFSTHTLHHVKSADSSTSSLSIRILKKSDFGSYSCEVSNRFGSDGTTFRVFEVTTTTTTTTSTTTLKPTTSRASSTFAITTSRHPDIYFGDPTTRPQNTYFGSAEPTTEVNKKHSTRDGKKGKNSGRKNTQRQTQIVPDSFFGSSSAKAINIIASKDFATLLPTLIAAVMSITTFVFANQLL